LATFDHENPLLKGIREHSQVWMSHGDTITAIPENFEIIASTDKVAVAAYQAKGEKLWGVQFHPEFLSRPMRPHPLFREFIGAALSEREGGQD